MFWSLSPTEEKRKLLKRFHLTDVVEEYMMERMMERRYRRDEEIVREGDPGNSMFFVAAGALNVLKRDAADQPQPVAVIKKGDFFGEYSLLGDEPRSSTVVAAGDVRLYCIEKSALAFLVDTNPTMKQELEQALLRRRQNDESKLGKR